MKRTVSAFLILSIAFICVMGGNYGFAIEEAITPYEMSQLITVNDYLKEFDDGYNTSLLAVGLPMNVIWLWTWTLAASMPKWSLIM